MYKLTTFFLFISLSIYCQKPKAKIVKIIKKVILNSEKVEFFSYDSIIMIDKISEEQLEKINRYLQKDFNTFLKENKAFVTNSSKQELNTFIDHTKPFTSSYTSLSDFTSTFLTISKLKMWCCRNGGLNGFQEQVKFTVDSKTLKPIKLNEIFYDEFKEVLIEQIRKHPLLKFSEEDGKVINQYICENEQKDYLIQKVKNAQETKEIYLWQNGLKLNTYEIETCNEMAKYGRDRIYYEIGLDFQELKKFIKPNNKYLHTD